MAKPATKNESWCYTLTRSSARRRCKRNIKHAKRQNTKKLIQKELSDE